MSARTGSRRMRPLDALLRKRQTEERRCLEPLAKCGLAVRVEREKLAAIVQRLDREVDHVRARAPASGAADGCRLVRERCFLEALRTAAGRQSATVSQRCEDLSDFQAIYRESRMRRRVAEALRDRRGKERDGNAVKAAEADAAASSMAAHTAGRAAARWHEA